MTIGEEKLILTILFQFDNYLFKEIMETTGKLQRDKLKKVLKEWHKILQEHGIIEKIEKSTKQEIKYYKEK